MMKLDLSKVTEWTNYVEHSQARNEDLGPIEQLRAEARSFLEQFSWCAAILDEYVGMNYPGIVGVFLFRIEPAREAVDDWVWVVVGDLPPAYITCEDSPNPATALDSYIGAMQEWVNASRRGEPVNSLIPVNVPPSADNAARLAARLKFLDERILANFQSDLKD